jgi:hypothetical protein
MHYAMKTCGVCGGTAPLFLTSALDGGEWSDSRPGLFTRRYLLYRRLGGRWEVVWKLWGTEKSFVPARSSSLYRQGRGEQRKEYWSLKWPFSKGNEWRNVEWLREAASAVPTTLPGSKAPDCEAESSCQHVIHASNEYRTTLSLLRSVHERISKHSCREASLRHSWRPSQLQGLTVCYG